MAVKIQPRVRRLAAPSAIWWRAARCLRAGAYTFARAWKWGVRAIYFFPQKKMGSKMGRGSRRGSQKCAWRAAPFLWQKDSFSCRDAHAFNRNSSSQVAVCVGSNEFTLVSNEFSLISSPAFPSSHERPRLVPSDSLKTIQWRVSGVSGRVQTAEHKTAKQG